MIKGENEMSKEERQDEEMRRLGEKRSVKLRGKKLQ